ncbi:hypothetical protein [Streptomyces sp. XH2]|uniref:hypothetical protein n=1 Tax=Streptomyces sp. XH2 TaxID=3412483 RepID=UPI003C79DB91
MLLIRLRRRIGRPCPVRPTVRTRTAALIAVVPAAAALPFAVLKAGHWQLSADRHRLEFTARPRQGCPRCHGDGGWWVGGANPEMEACPCWSDRPELRIRLLPLSPCPDEPPF